MGIELGELVLFQNEIDQNHAAKAYGLSCSQNLRRRLRIHHSHEQAHRQCRPSGIDWCLNCAAILLIVYSTDALSIMVDARDPRAEHKAGAMRFANHAQSLADLTVTPTRVIESAGLGWLQPRNLAHDLEQDLRDRAVCDPTLRSRHSKHFGREAPELACIGKVEAPAHRRAQSPFEYACEGLLRGSFAG